MFQVAIALFFISLDIKCKAMLTFIPDELVLENFNEIPQSIQHKNNENDENGFWSAMTFLDYQEFINPLQNYKMILEQDIFKTHQIKEQFKQEDNNQQNPEKYSRMKNLQEEMIDELQEYQDSTTPNSYQKQSKKILLEPEMINFMEEIQASPQDISSMRCSQIQ